MLSDVDACVDLSYFDPFINEYSHEKKSPITTTPEYTHRVHQTTKVLHEKFNGVSKKSDPDQTEMILNSVAQRLLHIR